LVNFYASLEVTRLQICQAAFTVRPLERIYGKEIIRAECERLSKAK